MLNLNDVAAGYGKTDVLHGLTLTFASGLLTAVVGPNGGGKSTLLRVAAGLLKPSRGSVGLGGHDLFARPAAARARVLAYVSQRPVTAPDFSVIEVVRLGRFAAARSAREDHLDRALGLMQLTELADAPVGTLSVGQQQRVAVARALAQLDSGNSGRPVALLADEPVAAMDPAQATATMRVLAEFAAAGNAVVVVLHDLSLAARFADRMAVIVGGRATASDSTATLLEGEELDRAFGATFLRVSDGGRTVGMVMR